MTRAGQIETAAPRLEPGDLNRAGIAVGRRGERPVDAAAEALCQGLGRGDREPLDPALCRNRDVGRRVVERTIRGRPDMGLDALRPGAGNADPGARQIRRHHRAAFTPGRADLQGCRPVKRRAEDARQPGELGYVGAQMRRNRPTRPAKGGVAGDGAGGDPDRQPVERDPLPKLCVQRKARPVADDRCDLGRQQRRHCHGSGQPEGGLGYGAEGNLGVEARLRSSRSGQPAVPVRQWPLAVERQAEGQPVRPPEPIVEQDPGRLARSEAQAERGVDPGQRHPQRDIPGKAVGAAEVEGGARGSAGDFGIPRDRGVDALAQNRGRQGEPRDGEPVESDGDREVRHAKIVGERRRRPRR